MTEVIGYYKGEVEKSFLDRFEKSLKYKSHKEIQTDLADDIFLACSGDTHLEGDIKVLFNGRLNRTCNNFATEIKNLYKKHGDNFAKQLNGSFRTLIFDRNKAKTLIYTDKLGKKNIFYSKKGKNFIFSSHMSPLLSHPEIHAEPDKKRIKYFMASRPASMTGKTLINSIDKMIAGQRLRISEENLHKKKYWDMYHTNETNYSDQQISKIIEKKLLKNIETSINNSKNLNIFLSGDLDSNLIAAMMSEVTDREINSITYGRKSKHFSSAEKISDFLDINHKKSYLPKEEIKPSDLWKLEEPRIDGFLTSGYYFNEKYDIEEAFYGFFTETLFPSTYQRVKKLDRLERIWPLPKIIKYAKIDKLVDRRLGTRIHAGLNVLDSDEYSAIEIHTENVPGMKGSDWVPEDNSNLEENLCREVDERWGLDDQGYYRNFEYLMMTDYLVPQLATAWEPIHAYTPYGHPELVKLGREIPFEQKKNRKFQKMIAREYLPDYGIEKPPSGAEWMVNEIIKPLIKANIDSYESSVKSMVERGFLKDEIASSNLLEIDIDGANRSLIIFGFKIWVLENWMKAFTDRKEPWKPCK